MDLGINKVELEHIYADGVSNIVSKVVAPKLTKRGEMLYNIGSKIKKRPPKTYKKPLTNPLKPSGKIKKKSNPFGIASIIQEQEKKRKIFLSF